MTSYDPRKVKFLIFWPFFETLTIFSNLRCWFQWEERIVESSRAKVVTPNFYTHQIMALQKSNFRFFDRFLKLFDFSRKLSFQI